MTARPPIDPASWTAQALAAAAASAPVPPRPPFNPRPPGSIQRDGATCAVLRVLCRAPAEWHRRWEIVAAVGRTDRTVDSSLLYLRDLRLVEIAADEARNFRWLRYRVLPAGIAYLERLLPPTDGGQGA